VTVGQDLVKLEVGGEPSGGKKQDASEETKEPASKDQETASQPSGEQEQSQPKDEGAPKQPEAPKQESKPEPPKQEQKPQPPKQESKSAPAKDEPKQAQPGGREERRVRPASLPCSRCKRVANSMHR
jgi:2-oxoglutarate dehydrogenase E2 component (dihydrolipoamide succinyltransferase)